MDSAFFAVVSGLIVFIAALLCWYLVNDLKVRKRNHEQWIALWRLHLLPKPELHDAEKWLPDSGMVQKYIRRGRHRHTVERAAESDPQFGHVLALMITRDQAAGTVAQTWLYYWRARHAEIPIPADNLPEAPLALEPAPASACTPTAMSIGDADDPDAIEPMVADRENLGRGANSDRR